MTVAVRNTKIIDGFEEKSFSGELEAKALLEWT